MLEPNAMNDRHRHMNVEHTARRSLMHNCVTSHLWLNARVIPSMHVHLCVALGCFLFISLVFYFDFLMFTSEFNERQVQLPVRLPLGTFTDYCRGIISYTSYSRTNDCIYNGYDNINLEPNAMNNIDTVAHMNMHYTQY